jgi:hypothetical protein
VKRLRALRAQLHALWRRAVYCRRGHHRQVDVCVFGELRLVCLDCPYIRTLGYVRPLGTNKLADHFPWEEQ